MEYSPATIEEKWQSKWEKDKVFKILVILKNVKKPCSYVKKSYQKPLKCIESFKITTW